MDTQTILVCILFLGALFYTGRIIYRSLNAKKGCGTSCKCGVDFSNLETDKNK